MTFLRAPEINFYKSELFCYIAAKQIELEYSQIFGCEQGKFPFKYLGIPMHHRKLSNLDRKEVEERFQKMLNSWKGKLLLVGGCLVLIISVLTSLSMFMLSFFEVSREILKRLDFYRFRFFWEGEGLKKKYRLIKWNIVYTPKDLGGLGILDLDLQNKCLLSKWLFRLINEEGVWQTILRNKYLKNRTITQVQQQPGDSHFWSGLMKVKENLLRMGWFKLGDGTQIRARGWYPNSFLGR
jgi:hypothetical protein